MMPYNIFKQGNKWKVYQVKADGSKTGAAVGEHATKAQAEKQLMALRINAEEVMSNFIQTQTANTEPAQELTTAASAEMYVDDEMYFMPGYLEAKTFEDLDAVAEAAEMRTRLQHRTDQLYQLFWRIWNDAEIPIQQKDLPWEKLFNEFLEVFRKEAGLLTDLEAAEGISEFAESATGAAIQIIDVQLQENEDRAPLYMEVELIQPGFGNQRDNHYYPVEVLERDAKVFEGVKMYVTDHNETERSERTEVSQIEKIIGFSEQGAPVARVAVFDPDFAEKTRNRAKLNKLDTLECSILAAGLAKPGKIAGKKAKIVEAITHAHAVDWVTRAGAGGRALRLSEFDTEVTMPDTQEPLVEIQAETEVTETVIQEQEPESASTDQPANQDAPAVPEQPTAEPEEVEEAAPALLTEAEITTHLGETKLPVIARDRLLKMQFADQTALQAAVAAELRYIEQLTRAGKPNAGQADPVQPARKSAAEIKEMQDRINAKWIS